MNKKNCHGFCMDRGFTLIELMVVISVIAILSTIALLGLRGAQDGAKDTKKIATIRGLEIGLSKYYADYDGYPVDWDAITSSSFDPAYVNFPDSGDEQLSHCGPKPRVPPCVLYRGDANAYTIIFFKMSGNRLTFINPL